MNTSANKSNQIDSSESRWDFLDVTEIEKRALNRMELEWVCERKFPTQYDEIMTALVDRAFAVIGTDRTLPDALLPDFIALCHLANQDTSTLSYTQKVGMLQYNRNVSRFNIDWRRQFAIQSIVCLCDAMFYYVYGGLEQHHDAFEIGDKSGTIDTNLLSVVSEIVMAAEFVAFAEAFSSLDFTPSGHQQPVARTVGSSKSIQQSKAAKARHKPAAELKNDCYEFYKAGKFRSYRDAARKFLNQLPKEKLSILKPSSAEKRLAEFLGKRAKLDD